MTQAAATPNKTKQKKDSRDIRAEAQKIANSIKIDGQSPAETKAIANGIQRGMEVFLRQQSEKARDLDKRTKKVKQLANQLAQPKIEKITRSRNRPRPANPYPGYFWQFVDFVCSNYFVDDA